MIDNPFTETVSLEYLKPVVVVFPPVDGSSITFFIDSANKSRNPPILNAVEFYTAGDLRNVPTAPDDADRTDHTANYSLNRRDHPPWGRHFHARSQVSDQPLNVDHGLHTPIAALTLPHPICEQIPCSVTLLLRRVTVRAEELNRDPQVQAAKTQSLDLRGDAVADIQDLQAVAIAWMAEENQGKLAEARLRPQRRERKDSWKDLEIDSSSSASLCNACGIRFKKEERRATAASAQDSSDGGISFLSWRLNVTDRPSLVHDFTR
ncbi:hypothetical protein NL676_010772 [Syzygium grande]|nr:hypothetical protein NL676_010772 [Syzygium grande]